MLDLNDIDSIHGISSTDIQMSNDIMDRSLLDNYEEQIKEQYENLENLGSDFLSDVPLNYKLIIMEELLEYINDNYIGIISYNLTEASPSKKIEIGSLVYSFICVDAFNTIIPNYLNNINCTNIEQFDKYYINNLKSDVDAFKSSFINTILSIIQNLNNLELLDKKAVQNENFIHLKKKYQFYIELVNYGDCNNFLNNYFRPIILKHMSDLLWRML